MDFKEKCKNALYGSILADAFGAQSERSGPNDRSLRGVKRMFGYGQPDHPKGTWSDDTSLILATMDSLCRGYNLDDLAANFCDWLFHGAWTPYGYVMDVGLTTFTALENYQSKSKSIHDCGGETEDDNGNGSLMRILPAALFFTKQMIAPAETSPADATSETGAIETFLEKIHEVSSITHNHPRSKMGCGIYSLLVRNLLLSSESDVLEKEDILLKTVTQAAAYYKKQKAYKTELTTYNRILSAKICTLRQEDISSSGYIVHTLETALWCFLHYETGRDIILQTATLGLDTDTASTASGGLAGLYYGLDDIDSEWISTLSKKEFIQSCIIQFLQNITPSL
ncbi:MAG: ADP-ribosylglycohydrolase family protein [Chitinivibrionales bacterium]|nr:ADP-ribosylglycohydrolase family protein [Chitinivibrionales bacterium]